MKAILKITTLTSLVIGAVLAASTPAYSATVTVDPSASWIGYMNVFALPSAGGGYMFGSGWGTADLTATFSGSTLTLGPNTIGDPSSYWYTPAGGPGAVGNKVMDASMYVQPADGTYTGQTLNFTGDVLANTLAGQTAPNGVSWTTVAFIKDFAPDYSSFNASTAPLVNGLFNISLATVSDPARHVQYGFETIGSNVWITDVGQFGNVQIIPVPEPSSLALVGLGILGVFGSRRQRSR